MKKIIGLILAFILVFAVAANAFAASKPKITKQPQTQTVKKGGKVTFEVKTSGTVKSRTWYFVDPVSGNKYTGKQLPGAVPGVKVVGKTNANKITLNKVPESMHGWTVYIHINGNGYNFDSEKVMLLISGMEPPASTPETASEQSASSSSGTEKAADVTGDDVPEGSEDVAESAGNDYEPETITVSSNMKILFRTTDPGTPYDRLEFVGSGSFKVSSEDPIASWTVNGMRFELPEPVKEFKVTNVTSSMSLTFKVARPSAAEITVDENNMCKVICKGCKFTYIAGGLRSVSEGEVPAGARINIIADGTEYSKNGYVINGGEAINPGKASFQLTVTEETSVICRK